MFVSPPLGNAEGAQFFWFLKTKAAPDGRMPILSFEPSHCGAGAPETNNTILAS